MPEGVWKTGSGIELSTAMHLMDEKKAKRASESVFVIPIVKRTLSETDRRENFSAASWFAVKVYSFCFICVLKHPIKISIL